MTPPPRRVVARRPAEEMVTRALKAGLRVELDGYEVAWGVDKLAGTEEPVIVAQRTIAGSTEPPLEFALALHPEHFVQMCRKLDEETLIQLAFSTTLRVMANERNDAREAAFLARRAAEQDQDHTT